MNESRLTLVLDARRARQGGPEAFEARQQARLAEMLTFARANSPYYRELYAGLPERVEDVTHLPVTSKKQLMTRFDDWVTDRAVTFAEVQKLVSDRDRIGERFLGKYTVATTSGTTGTPGVFLIDDRALAVTNAIAVRMLSDWLTAREVLRIVLGAARMAMVIATGGHYASTAAASRLKSRAVKVFSVQAPMSETVAGLNAFKPAVLAPYASTAALLANEQSAGRLQISPVFVVVTAEGLPSAEYERISRVFGAKVRNSYAATECPFLSYNCEFGWLHVNSDWLVLEPVDANHHPTPPGELSHTVLVSNLANRIQPILRYDLGDRVLQRPDRCECGNPLPAIRVQGRAADVLVFPTPQGERISVPPLALEVDHVKGIALFQLVQTAPTTLRVRLQLEPGADPEGAWQAVMEVLASTLEHYGLGHILVERGHEPPEASASGKFRTVVPIRA